MKYVTYEIQELSWRTITYPVDKKEAEKLCREYKLSHPHTEFRLIEVEMTRTVVIEDIQNEKEEIQILENKQGE